MIYLGVFELFHVLEGNVRVDPCSEIELLHVLEDGVRIDPGSEIDVLYSITLELEKVVSRLW